MDSMREENIKEFKEGMGDGIPIGLGYFAVSFALGIAMKDAGMTWVDGFFMSLLNLASAGEYAGTQVILANGSYLQMILMTFVANARYMLMSASLSQKLSEKTTTPQRMLIGYSVTDELFGIAINRKEYLNPVYFYGAMLVAVLPWAIGTSLGIVMGNILPTSLVSALSVALYGMFLAIVIPVAKKDKTVLILVIISYLSSTLCTYLPIVKDISSGTRIIILTVLIAGIASFIKPINEEEHL